MLYKSSLLFGSLLLLAACSHPFQAASPNQSVPGSPQVARAAAKGVSMTAQINAWTGDPAGLESIVTPVKVSLMNESDHPVSLRYKNFTLSNPAGVHGEAIPPFEIKGSTDPVAESISPSYTFRSFYPYPAYRMYGSAYNFWPDNFGWDAAWYNSAYQYWSRELPTADMLRKAIPEGVLNPGGEVSGYLYFQLVPSDANMLDLQSKLFDATTHDPLATLDLPFIRKK